jgi:hypothetical protein
MEEKMQLHLDEERLGQLMAVAEQRGTTQSKDIQDVLGRFSRATESLNRCWPT